jgi:hypothetical protein
MLSNSLLPYKYRKIGWLILIPSFLLGISFALGGFNDFEPKCLDVKMVSILFSDSGSNAGKFFSLVQVNLTNTIISTFIIVGALLVAFTKEKNENESIARIRLAALLWAVIVNYILLLTAIILIYGDHFLSVLIYSMFTPILLFIIRYNYVLRKYLKSA